MVLQHMPHQVILVQPLHDKDDHSLLLMVEAAQQGVVKPLVDTLSLRFRQGFFGFEGIIDDDEIRTPAGQDSADRGCHTESLGYGREVVGRRLVAGEPSGRKKPLIEGAHHQCSAIPGKLISQILAIAGADDLGFWNVAEQKGGKGHAGTMGLEGARRQIDDQPPALSLETGLQFRRHHLDVRIA